MLDIIIKNTTVVTMDTHRNILENCSIGIKDGIITFIGQEDSSAVELEASQIIDSQGCLVFPGMINIHTHSYQSLLKGLACDKTLSEWLSTMALPAAAALNPEAALYGSLATAIENIHSGVTIIVDMYPRVEPEFFTNVMKGYRDIGNVGIFAAGFIHDDKDDETGEALNVIKQNIKQCAYMGKSLSPEGFPPIALAPFQIWNNSNSSLKMTKELSDELHLPVITHALETPFDNEACHDRHRASEIETIKKYGLLNINLSLIHGVTATSEEIAEIAKSGASVSFSPVCNMFLGSGFAPIPEYRDAGVLLTLCTEGGACNNTNNMIETLKFAALTQTGFHQDPAVVTSMDVLEMATINAAKCLGIDKYTGSIEVGKRADLFIADPLACATSIPVHNPVSTLVYSSTRQMVKTVLVGGKIVLQDGVLQYVDEREVLEKVQDVAEVLAKRAGIDMLV